MAASASRRSSSEFRLANLAPYWPRLVLAVAATGLLLLPPAQVEPARQLLLQGLEPGKRTADWVIDRSDRIYHLVENRVPHRLAKRSFGRSLQR